MVDRIRALPAPIRHGAAVFIAVFVIFVANSVISSGGVTDLPVEVFKDALNAAALALATLIVLWVSPLTDAYGIGKGKTDVELGGPR